MDEIHTVTGQGAFFISLLAPVLKYVISSASQLAGPTLLQSLWSALTASPSAALASF